MQSSIHRWLVSFKGLYYIFKTNDHLSGYLLVERERERERERENGRVYTCTKVNSKQSSHAILRKIIIFNH